LNTENIQQGISALEKVYKSAMPSGIFQYDFMDQLNNRQFIEEQRWQQVISVATFASLIICSLGLFGLAHLSAYQRIKEIGIRKVLGASVMQVVVLMSSRFLSLVCGAFLVACPVAWILMNKWLMNFAYRIEVGPGVFIVAALMCICVALLAVSMQSLRSAMVNPVKSLKTE
jgi:putative ABC transport system permease protein